MQRLFLLIISCLLLILACNAFSASKNKATKPSSSFTLVKAGKPAATIIVSQKASKAALFAVEELQYHIRRITGATLPLAYDNQTVTGPVVLVGQSKLTSKLGLTNNSLKSQEYVIKFSPKTLLLMGKDDISKSTENDILPRVEGKFGKAIKFDGVNSYFAVNDPNFTDDEGTLEAWIWMPAKVQEVDGTILRMDSGSPWTYHILQRLMGTSKIDYRVYDSKNVTQILSVDLAEGWHHIMATHSKSAGTLELFVDGVKQGSVPYKDTSCNTATLYVGGLGGPMRGGQPGVGNAFIGLIDEIRISNTVRKPIPGGPTEAFVKDSNTQLLLHLDEPSGRPITGQSSSPDSSMAPDYFTEKGTMDAVYDFLVGYCGVDWYAPGEIGFVCPKTKTLVVKGNNVRRVPSFRYRWMTPTSIFLPTPAEHIPDNEVALWKLRMKIGGEPFWSCHSFYGYADRFLKSHPDWFAQGYGGDPPQMCYTNQGFIDQVTSDAKEYFNTGKVYPGAAVAGDNFGLCPMDNASWCQCPVCQAKRTKSELNNPQFSNGKVSNYFFEFVNKVATETRKTNPNKWIAALAYSDYAYYPDKVKLEPNIGVMMCLHTRNWWCPSMEKNDKKVFNGWVSHEGGKRPLYVWLYYNFPALNAQYDNYSMFPGFFVHRMAEQTRMYKKAGIRGIFMEHSCEFGQTYLGDQLELYITWKMCNDINVDVEKLIDKFFTNYYGKAAKPMKKLYLAMEETFINPKNYPEYIQKSNAHRHQTRELAYEYLATPNRMLGFVKLMYQAETLASSDVEKQRVDYFNRGIIQPLVKGMDKYKEFKKNQNATLPKVIVPKISVSKPGDPTSVDWTKALDMGKWRQMDGDTTDRLVVSKIAHDGKYLYVQIQEDIDPKKLKSNDDQLWLGDDFEMFFAASRHSSYRQLSVGPSGKFTTTAYNEDKSEWTPGASVISDTSGTDTWLVRAAIPLSQLTSTGISKQFYANFYRATGGSTGLLAWSPNFTAGFHQLNRTGEFTLGE